MGETVTDLQILGCELHKNVFVDQAPPGHAGGAITLPRSLSRYKGREGGKGKEGLMNSKEGRKGREGKGIKW